FFLYCSKCPSDHYKTLCITMPLRATKNDVHEFLSNTDKVTDCFIYNCLQELLVCERTSAIVHRSLMIELIFVN
ncbi:hypothetical protein S83_055743, partial [Arachis hypogaea]